MYRKFVKRLLDIILALIAIPFIGLIVIIIGPIIYFEDKGSVFYKAKRRGRNGKVFNMYKLRSMKMDAPDLRNADNSAFNSSDDPRVTKIGRFIRRTSLDEISQVFNVLTGEMSWIGPRASIPREGYTWNDLDDMQKKRLTIRPGITGYTASVYRNSIPRDEKQKMDCYYVDNLSFILDVKIVFWTIQTVLLHKNLYTNKAEEIKLVGTKQEEKSKEIINN